MFSRAAFATVTLLLLLAAAAAVAAAEHNSRTVESHTVDHKTTEKKRYDLRVPSAGSRVRLRVKATVREGQIRLLVRDASGRVRQEAVLTPSKSTPSDYDVDSGEVRSAAGAWTVEVELKEAVGSYEFAFTLTGE
jgi:hypothetical protein